MIKRLVFDDQAWNGKDVGDNSQFWKEAEILATYIHDGTCDVLWPDGRITHGHFYKDTKPIPGEEDKVLRNVFTDTKNEGA